MNLGFVGSEEDWRRFLTALPPGGDDRVELPTFDIDSIITNPQIGAIVLSGPMEQRADRLRRILHAGRPCLCCLPVHSSSLVYHEIAMLAGDTHVPLVPDLPGRLHPAWTELVSLCRSESLGPIHGVTVERNGPVPPGQRLLTQSYVEVADLLSSIAGDVIEVTTTGDAATARVIVLHRTATGVLCEVRLTGVATGTDQWRIVVEGSRGRAELVFSDGPRGAGDLRWSDETGAHEQHSPPPQDEHSIFAQLRRAIASESHMPTWSDATRAAELADCAWLSLERRRAVDVYHEKRNELASFKGRMTSLGCGLIWVTITVLFLIAAGEGLKIPGMRWVAAGLVVVWLFFVGLQTLRWVLPAEGESGRRDQNECDANATTP
jgi:predicted dehydrogenase